MGHEVPGEVMRKSERESTQEFTVRNVLVDYCGQKLTGDTIERIVQKLTKEMKDGPTSWAFKVEGKTMGHEVPGEKVTM